MGITHAERRLRALLVLWLVLFAGGVITIGVASRLPTFDALYRATPLLALTWVGQALLFLASWYLFSGIRDNELLAFALTVYKLVSGTAMILFLLTGGPTAPDTLAVVGGGLLDYVMAGLTLGLWLYSRRIRALRMPFADPIASSIEEEPSGPAQERLRGGLTTAAIVFWLLALGLLVGGFALWAPRTVPARIAAGNAVAVYACLAVLATLAAETPRRRAYAQDIVALVSLFCAAALPDWVGRFQPGGPLRTLFWALAGLHLLIALGTLYLRARAAQADRPGTRFLGPWFHLILDRFADVILQGEEELLTSRQVADTADRLLADIGSPRLNSLKWALALIELGGLLQARVPLTRMGRWEREQYLVVVFQRGFGPFRSLIKIKQLVFFIYYSDPTVGAELGFAPFPQRERFRRAQEAGQVPTGPVAYPPPVMASELDAEVCVIGSGAGGAVVAARLAQAGKRVVILEAGPYVQRDLISHDERAMQPRIYREGGLQLTLDYDMYVLQGRCVGGSTLINNGICFGLPDDVRRHWQDLGANLDEDELQGSFRRVTQELQLLDLAERQDLVENGSLRFMAGCAALGLPAGWFKINFPGCIGCGHCTIGCAYDKKLSADRAYLPQALGAGALLVSGCEAKRIDSAGPRARWVECRRADGSTLRVRARQIIISGGAIRSSLLLRRSGIHHNVGTRLGFNVGSPVFAEFPETIDSFDGLQMCAYHERPRYILETIAMSPGSFAASLPGWFQDHFDHMARYRYFATAGALIGSASNGRVRTWPLAAFDDLISPIDFQLTIPDLRRLRDGVQQLCRVFLAAGARRVIPATFLPLELTHPSQVYRLDDLVVENDDLAFGSAHPQGGNPLSDDPRIGAVDHDLGVYGYDNLFVADASVFPTTIRVNPQLTVMALADYAAGRILARG